ncbi:MAG: ISAs1 family transposase [Bacteroidota bacterium]|nr:ISAs1 family transposase [Bacteroidota bacterium]
MGQNSYGYLATISAGGSIKYSITGMNAREQLIAATYGSGAILSASFGFDTYVYPSSTSAGTVQDYRYSFNASTGNLNSRQNFKRSLSESFSYDTLDRLLTVTGPQNLTMTYNANGNLSTKSDVGTTSFSYGANAGPYALTSVTSTGLIPSDTQTATYTSFEKVNTLTEGVCSAAFVYNSDQQRAKMDITQSGTNILTRWYAGSSYMKETADAGHGRVENRKYEAISNLTFMDDKEQWPGIKSVVRVTSQRYIKQTGTTSSETRYYIASVDADPIKLNHAIRSHWSIENNLHWMMLTEKKS